MNSIRAVFAAALLAACLSASAQTPAQPTRADAEKDPVFKAMLAELDRSMNQLQLKDFQKPFFIQYRLEDVDRFETNAEFGAVNSSQRYHGRIVRVTVRVGDYKSDSSGERGDGAIEMAPLGDDPIALRSALWAGTDQAYKNALAAYAKKQAELKQVETPPQADDFSKENPLISLAEPLKLNLDEPAWQARVAHLSGLYRTDESVKAGQHDVQSSTAEFHARAVTTWIVSSEGAIVRKSATGCEESWNAGTQAADGMRIELSHSSIGLTPDDLNEPAAFDKYVLKQIASLGDLRKAPVVEEEYHGPVLLGPGAGTFTVHSLLADAVTATRPKLGTEARANGPFASSYHARVLPDTFDVVDDPSLKVYDGKKLVGAYDVDDEGIPAQAVTLVTGGRLENYLIGREPVRDLPQSNGHSRATAIGAPAPSIGVLKVTAKDGLSENELNHELFDLAKERGLKDVYYINELGGKMTPRMLYRVTPDGTPTGKRELVRGAALDDLDLRALRSSIVAAGKDLRVANYLNDVPETVLAPALLVDDVTIRRANQKNDKLPFYPPPQ
ncbi:MAG: metallopeptidase TldD-related protein [Terracidiphilus sp.]|jgi:predicted Zn-dependent protease